MNNARFEDPRAVERLHPAIDPPEQTEMNSQYPIQCWNPYPVEVSFHSVHALGFRSQPFFKTAGNSFL